MEGKTLRHGRLTLRRGGSEPRGLRVGIGQRDAEAEFPQGKGDGRGFAYEYHVGGGLEVGTGLLWDGFIRARVLGYIHEEGVQIRQQHLGTVIRKYILKK